MKHIKLEQKGHVALVTVSRPEALNALSAQVLKELVEAFAGLGGDDGVRAVILTGEGKAFVAGADVAEMKDFTPEQARDYADLGARALAAVETLPQPVVAAVNGYALGGGCELALACDLRLASEKARFGQPEAGLGIIPGFGGTQRLPRTISPSAAMELVLTGRIITAREALGLGLVSAVHPPEALLPEALALAGAIAANAPLAVRAAKKALRRAAGRFLAEDIAAEREAFAACFATRDQKSAMAAFVEKRKLQEFEGK